MSEKKLVIVESPTKARTIKKFLSSDYAVESCMGHARDLPESSKDIPAEYKKYDWAKLGVNVEDGFRPIYRIPSGKAKVVNDLKRKAKTSAEVILATDEDREGESISWHLKEILNLKKGKVFKRMVFHEITKSAIREALKNFRSINMNLVYAQEARRILDRLVGYTISPVLWKNVARGLSAGRVQSAAVRLLSERELKRFHFKKSKYWSLEAELSKKKSPFTAELYSYDKQNLAGSSDFDRETGRFLKTKKLLLDEKKAQSLMKSLKSVSYKVSDVKTQSVSKKPPPPFTTSTLQQEANRKLSLSSKETMSLAQQLYERGFITYMRTDAVFLSQQAVTASRKAIGSIYGKKYLPKTAKVYKNKSKGAQEAHEAIRPAGAVFAEPKNTKLSGNLFKLYQMIWQRTLASQTVDCLQERVSIKIKAGSRAEFTASGMTIAFDGWYRIYWQNGASEKGEKQLPQLKIGDSLELKKLLPSEHETKPPARFTEASLVQTLEKEGIGRPSTYAAIIAVIQKRGYVFKDKNMLIPTMTALIVTQFLEEHFPDYIDMGFTSDMEKVLDDIALGSRNHTKYLDQIYFGKKGLKNQVKRHEKITSKDRDRRSLKIESLKGFTFFAGPYGAYVVKDSKKKEKESVSLPPRMFPGDLTVQSLEDLFHQKSKGQESLGKDPKTGQSVYVLMGRFGPYVQRGEIKENGGHGGKKSSKKDDVKRVSIPQGMPAEDVDLKTALDLLALPQVLCLHPKTSKEVKKGIGRFGPYIVHDGDFRSVRPLEKFLKLTKKDALEILSRQKKSKKLKVLKELGVNPKTGEKVRLMDGKYGPYVQHKKQSASLPKTINPKDIKLKQALDLLKSKKTLSGKKKSFSKTANNLRRLSG